MANASVIEVVEYIGDGPYPVLRRDPKALFEDRIESSDEFIDCNGFALVRIEALEHRYDGRIDFVPLLKEQNRLSVRYPGI